VRPYVIEKGFTNCTQCEEYGCSKLVERWVTREEIQSKSPHPIPAIDSELFIQPYENKVRLDALRSTRSSEC